MAPSNNKKKQQNYQLPSHILGGRRFSVTPGSGLVVTDEMKQILAQPGFIRDREGGAKLRALYVDHSIGFTPNELSNFGMACLFGALEEVQKIFDAGTQPDLNGTETAFQAGYVTIVIWGSQRIERNERTRHSDVLRLLISHKAPLDIPDICGFTALHHFVTNPNPGSRYPELLRLMLESGANPDVQDRYGVVPLYPAFEHKFIQAIELLMEFGASLDIADADNLTPKMMYIKMGPQVTAVIQKWLRKRAGEEAPRQDKECDACHKTDVPLKNCSRCLIGRYCSRECQTKAWPSHKKVCKAFSESATVTVKPFYHPMSSLVSPSDLVRQATGIIPPPSSGSQKALKPLNYPKDVVIKVQTPVATSPHKADMLVYTKKRDFICQVRRIDDPKAFDSLESVVKSKGVYGLKAYFSATLKSEDELVIKISEVLAEQPF